ncbi:aryl hydrocarbon receptor nuclear translocator-like protein 2 isoform X2 [Galleria mellonella]|uniref:Aryl hydrocarbon receptor nuclear translocator-like protein 2 isoform X2 n=1 Tax=Galleria mellonella TaxID=7137 RepID=A0A6J3C8Q3_GALME|nr:aryl hydrocarbon receptor nuclear translocator-like protein 2 isoform X2 [Galleria mellonella]
MADTQSRNQGVIRSTREYLQAPLSPPSSPIDVETPTPSSPISTLSGDDDSPTTSTLRDSPREIRNKAEKQRRDKLNQSIAELASMVPPVVAANRKIEKTGILRLTAHYLRAHQYVFGESIDQSNQVFSPGSIRALLAHLNGFLLTTTYKGIVVVVSQNIRRYLGYTVLELLGHNILNIIHEDDREMMREQLMPRSDLLGSNGELLVPDEPNGRQMVAAALASDKRRFIVRFKKFGQRSEPSQYLTCHVEGSLRKSDSACQGYNRCCQLIRRARARSDNPCSSGNDVVFVGVVRPTTDTFISESEIESFRMEYRTRHSIDGQIIQCEQRIALVTGYMTHEVHGVNAMNFMHRDDVRWVIIALREMYDQHRLFGESCYRLMTKNGQFIYMRTRGRLDVDHGSRAVTSFVCTNTVVDEKEGQYLIKKMKKKFTLMVNNNEEPPEELDTNKETNDSQVIPVEDPRQLEKVILHLVTNLPSPGVDNIPRSISPDRFEISPVRLSIIPPKKDRIVKAIEKIYSIISPLPKSCERTYHCEQSETTNISAYPPITDVEVPLYQQNQVDSSQPLTMIPTQYNGPTISETKFSNIYYQSQPADIILNNSNYFNTTNSNIKSLPRNINTPTGNYNGTASITFSNVSLNKNSDSLDDANESGSDIKYHVYVSPQRDDNKIPSTSKVPETITAQSGIKRPSDCNDQEIASKKKVAAKKEEEIHEQNFLLDDFFDEDLLNSSFSQFDAALDSILDPTFPDLLISADVQEILKELDNAEDSHSDP